MAETSEDLRFQNVEEYIERRVRYKIAAYTKKGDRYRWGYISMASVAAIAAATVPVLINLSGVDPIVPTLLSLLVTILVGLEGLVHFREHWKNYDLMKSFLRQETNLFQVGGGPYRQTSNATEAFKLFVERVEEEIAKERVQTIQMRTAPAPEREQKRDAALDTPLVDGERAVPTPATAGP